MSQDIILNVDPYYKEDNLIAFDDASVKLDGIDKTFEIIGNRCVLYNAEVNNVAIKPRECAKTISIKLKPKWLGNKREDILKKLVGDHEDIHEALSLRIRAVCPKTCWSGKTEVLKIEEINRKELDFEIDLDDVYEHIIIESFITRETESDMSDGIMIATSPYAKISATDELFIQIDEVEPVGGDHFPIKPENTKDYLFRIISEDASNIPVIHYSDDLEGFFKRNDLNTVNVIFTFIMPAFMEAYFRWLVFECKFNDEEKSHKSLLNKFSKVLKCKQDEILDLINEENIQKKTDEYIKLSKKLFEECQNKLGINYKKETKKYIDDEIKLKESL